MLRVGVLEKERARGSAAATVEGEKRFGGAERDSRVSARSAWRAEMEGVGMFERGLRSSGRDGERWDRSAG